MLVQQLLTPYGASCRQLSDKSSAGRGKSLNSEALNTHAVRSRLTNTSGFHAKVNAGHRNKKKINY